MGRFLNLTQGVFPGLMQKHPGTLASKTGGATAKPGQRSPASLPEPSTQPQKKKRKPSPCQVFIEVDSKLDSPAPFCKTIFFALASNPSELETNVKCSCVKRNGVAAVVLSKCKESATSKAHAASEVDNALEAVSAAAAPSAIKHATSTVAMSSVQPAIAITSKWNTSTPKEFSLPLAMSPICPVGYMETRGIRWSGRFPYLKLAVVVALENEARHNLLS